MPRYRQTISINHAIAHLRVGLLNPASKYEPGELPRLGPTAVHIDMQYLAVR